MPIKRTLSNLQPIVNALTNNDQIKGMTIVTQAEYDALPSTKTSNGVIYLIRG